MLTSRACASFAVKSHILGRDALRHRQSRVLSTLRVQASLGGAENEDSRYTEETVSCSVVIRQSRGTHAYRYGIDALLLATDLPVGSLRPSSAVCELGAASGVVSLSVAARCPNAEVYAVERQESLHELLCHNVARNVLLAPRVRPVLADIRSIPAHSELVPHGCASLVLCNPPFYARNGGDSMRETERVATRHELYGSLTHFAEAARVVAAPLGFVKFIIPPRRLPDLLQALQLRGARREDSLHLWSLRFLHPEAGEEAYLLEATLQKGRPPPSGMAVREPLFLRDKASGEWTDEVAERVAFAALPPGDSSFRAGAIEALSEVDVYKGAVERLVAGGVAAPSVEGRGGRSASRDDGSHVYPPPLVRVP